MNWNRLPYAGAGLVLLIGLVLHQGEVPGPGAEDSALLSGTALRDPATQAARDRSAAAVTVERECAAADEANGNSDAGHACSDSRDEKRLAQNDPPK